MFSIMKRIEMDIYNGWEWIGMGEDTCPANPKCGETIFELCIFVYYHFHDEKDAQRNLAQVGGLCSPKILFVRFLKNL